MLRFTLQIQFTETWAHIQTASLVAGDLHYKVLFHSYNVKGFSAAELSYYTAP